MFEDAIAVLIIFLLFSFDEASFVDDVAFHSPEHLLLLTILIFLYGINSPNST